VTAQQATITVLHAGVFENLLDTAFGAAVEQSDGVTLKTVMGPAVQSRSRTR
jgi:ABC-type molybdate transport system substrate-binding protein